MRIRVDPGSTRTPLESLNAITLSPPAGSPITFDTASPGTIVSSRSVTGLEQDELILAADFRPSDGSLFVLGSTNRLYRVDAASGFASRVSFDSFTPTLDGTDFGMTFDVSVQRRIDLTGRVNATLRWDVFNLFDRANLGNPERNIAAATVGVAQAYYTGGKFWPELWRLTDLPRPHQQQIREIWGQEFLSSLAHLGLDTFSGNQRHHYVGPIMMHAGIPTNCLTKVFALLLERTAQYPGLDAPTFHRWAISGDTRLHSLNKPAEEFIRAGGDYSLDVIDRCLTLLHRIRDTPTIDAGEVGRE